MKKGLKGPNDVPRWKDEGQCYAFLYSKFRTDTHARYVFDSPWCENRQNTYIHTVKIEIDNSTKYVAVVLNSQTVGLRNLSRVL